MIKEGLEGREYDPVSTLKQTLYKYCLLGYAWGSVLSLCFASLYHLTSLNSTEFISGSQQSITIDLANPFSYKLIALG